MLEVVIGFVSRAFSVDSATISQVLGSFVATAEEDILGRMTRRTSATELNESCGKSTLENK